MNSSVTLESNISLVKQSLLNACNCDKLPVLLAYGIRVLSLIICGFSAFHYTLHHAARPILSLGLEERGSGKCSMAILFWQSSSFRDFTVRLLIVLEGIDCEEPHTMASTIFNL